MSLCLCTSHSRPGSPAGFFFFFNDTATTEIYTLSLHDALPISSRIQPTPAPRMTRPGARRSSVASIFAARDRKSTRLNSSHDQISYAVFCLKKKKLFGGSFRHRPAALPHGRHDTAGHSVLDHPT